MAETIERFVGSENLKEIEPYLTDCESEKLKKLSLRNPKVALLLSIFVGFIGIDRLYQGGIKMMLIKLAANILTFGTWYIADFYYTRYTVLQDNKQKILSTITA